MHVMHHPITHPKIASLEPHWAPFPGFSLLFDNPDAPDLDLYRRLAAALGELDRDQSLRRHLLCPLPPASYHTTVWDGINAENLAEVTAALQPEWAAFMQGLPETLPSPPPSICTVTKAPLMKQPAAPIQFRFDRLCLWGDAVLVARLAPADDTSAACLDELCAARADLSGTARQTLGISAGPDYEPHVSLGYFANRTLGRQAQALLADWSAHFEARLSGSVITYRSIGLYAFTDMANFFKFKFEPAP